MNKRDNERPNAGWKLEDRHYLHKHDNAQADLNIQILTEEDWEEEDKELREYWCSICHGKLDYLKQMDMWHCSACVEYYDQKIQDVPIKDLRESKVRTYAELEHYHQSDEDDIFVPFIEGINPDEQEDYDLEGVELVSSSADNRIQHLKVKGDITKALSAQHDFE